MTETTRFLRRYIYRTLFRQSEPVTIRQLAENTGMRIEEVESCLEELLFYGLVCVDKDSASWSMTEGGRKCATILTPPLLQLSAEETEARKPLPVEVLANALTDSVHTNRGILLDSIPIRAERAK